MKAEGLYSVRFPPPSLTAISEKSGEKPEVDEDDYEQADRETVKAREWDEFKEQNPR